MKAKLIRQAANKGGFKHLQSDDLQMFNWASAILDLNLLHTKLIKAGGKLDALSPQEQEKYRQLTGQTPWKGKKQPHYQSLNHISAG